MERVPEPELMDDQTQAAAYAGADFEAPHQALIAALFEHFPDLPETGTALDLGCGPADITRRFAEARPGWTVHGIDGSAEMLAFGRQMIEARGLGDRVVLSLVRLPEGRPPRETYDLVFSNSLLHHLHDPSVLWSAVRQYTRPGARVFIMDLMRPESTDAAEAMVERYSGGEPAVLRRDFFASLCAAFTVDEVRAQLAAAGLALAVEPISDRHLVVWGR